MCIFVSQLLRNNGIAVFAGIAVFSVKAVYVGKTVFARLRCLNINTSRIYGDSKQYDLRIFCMGIVNNSNKICHVLIGKQNMPMWAEDG